MQFWPLVVCCDVKLLVSLHNFLFLRSSDAATQNPPTASSSYATSMCEREREGESVRESRSCKFEILSGPKLSLDMLPMASFCCFP